MQPRQTMFALLGAMTIFYVVFYGWLWLYPPPPPTTQPTTTAPSTQAATATRPTTAPVLAESGPAPAGSAPASDVGFAEGVSRDHVFLGSDQAGGPYPMRLEIDPVGAEVANAWLRGHYETVKREHTYKILQPVLLPNGNTAGSFATPEIRFEDRSLTVSLVGRVWSLDAEASSETKKVFVLRINDAAGKPLANVIKTYELLPQPASQQTYDLKLSLNVQNLSSATSKVSFWQQGSVGFRQDVLRYEDRSVVMGVWNGTSVKAKTHPRKDIPKDGGALVLGKDGESTRVAWVGEGNNFFACIMAPAGRTSADSPILFNSVETRALIPGDPKETFALTDQTFRLAVAPREVPAGGTAGVTFDCFLGPKSKPAFQNVEEYAKRDYYSFMTATYQGCCSPAPLTGFMMTLLNIFHKIPPHNYGIAIIMLVLVVRVILHPITKKSQVNMVKMQKQMARVQPKIEAAKKKFANDKAALGQAQMEIYKEEGINPAGQFLSCMPLFLQMPILGALWTALAASVEMRHAPFDPWWIKDLAGPDGLISWADKYPHGINIPLLSMLTGPINSFNLLPILMGISQLLQMKYMPRVTTGPGAVTGPAAQQMEQQRKMMMWMSGIFVFMFYNQPSGLNLYWMASNLFGILEQWRIRKHIADIESRPPPDPGPRNGPKDGPPRKPSWFVRGLEWVQNQAEEAKKQQGQRK
jgi:YidC/Oxa1 family membrane protein insertase